MESLFLLTSRPVEGERDKGRREEREHPSRQEQAKASVAQSRRKPRLREGGSKAIIDKQ